MPSNNAAEETYTYDWEDLVLWLSGCEYVRDRRGTCCCCNYAAPSLLWFTTPDGEFAIHISCKERIVAEGGYVDALSKAVFGGSFEMSRRKH